MYFVIMATGVIFQYPDVIPDDPFGEILSTFHVLVVYVILSVGLMLILISVVSPEQPILANTALKKLALAGIPLVAAAVVIDVFHKDKEQGKCICDCLQSICTI